MINGREAHWTVSGIKQAARSEIRCNTVNVGRYTVVLSSTKKTVAVSLCCLAFSRHVWENTCLSSYLTPQSLIINTALSEKP